MPTIFIFFGFRFMFYSNDHAPIHVHILKDGHEAKYNVDPVELVFDHGFKKHYILRTRAYPNYGVANPNYGRPSPSVLSKMIPSLRQHSPEAYWLDEVHNGEESQMQMRKTMPISWTNALLLLLLRKMPIQKITEFFE